MPPDGQPAPDDQLNDDQLPVGSPTPEPIPSVTPPDDVRNSAAYRELQRQNRQLASQAAKDRRAAAAAQTEAERIRLAAEAQEQADLEAEIAATLGEDGVAAYNELAELTASDPRAAAKRMATLIAQARAQSPAPAGGPAPSSAPAPEGGAPVPGTPPPPRGLGADAPLGQPPAVQDETQQIIAGLEKTYGETVERVQNPETRRRVTMKDRATAFIDYLGAAYLKSGARPSTKP